MESVPAGPALNASAGGGYGLDLSAYSGQWTYFEEYDCYGLENVVYCAAPAAPDLQRMNIYVPAAYMNGGRHRHAAGVIGYSHAQTAPILYANGVAGYMEAAPNTIAAFNPFLRNSIDVFLSQGYVYVSVGSRGRGTQAEDGRYIGKSPEGLIDLKAGIRFLKANDGVLAGSAQRIVSQGVAPAAPCPPSSRRHRQLRGLHPLSEAIGAVMTETDDIYAAQCYCPITDLEHADLAYEWQYVTDTSYDGFMNGGGDLTPLPAGAVPPSWPPGMWTTTTASAWLPPTAPPSLWGGRPQRLRL